MNLADQYLTGLKAALSEEKLEELNWGTGAQAEDITALLTAFPECPQSLVSLLRQIDGTYYRQYGDHKICVYLLGSDVSDGEYPYYLLSAREMLSSSQEDEDVSYLLEDTDDGDCPVDPRIGPNGLTAGKYLHFSDCMNNGGSSRLYIDFSPSEKGVCGQIIRYLHDPDEYWVIADSFDEYLQDLMDKEYAFLNEED